MTFAEEFMMDQEWLAYERLGLLEENERLKKACLTLEMALSEAGDDYPGSKMQEWCIQQIELARQIMRGP